MIKQATKEDIKSLYHLENTLFAKDDFGISLHLFYYHIKHNNLFVYKDKDTIVAYILWLQRKNYYRLYSLGVTSSFQHKGLGTKLLEYSFLHLDKKKFQLEVKVGNLAAIKLYEKNGFKIKKLLKEFYPKRKDGYLMVKG